MAPQLIITTGEAGVGGEGGGREGGRERRRGYGAVGDASQLNR